MSENEAGSLSNSSIYDNNSNILKDKLHDNKDFAVQVDMFFEEMGLPVKKVLVDAKEKKSSMDSPQQSRVADFYITKYYFKENSVEQILPTSLQTNTHKDNSLHSQLLNSSLSHWNISENDSLECEIDMGYKENEDLLNELNHLKTEKGKKDELLSYQDAFPADKLAIDVNKTKLRKKIKVKDYKFAQFEAEKSDIISFYEHKINSLQLQVEKLNIGIQTQYKKAGNEKHNEDIEVLKKELVEQFEKEKVMLIKQCEHDVNSIKSEKGEIIKRLTFELEQVQAYKTKSFYIKSDFQAQYKLENLNIIKSYELQDDEVNKATSDIQPQQKEKYYLFSLCDSKINSMISQSEFANENNPHLLNACEGNTSCLASNIKLKCNDNSDNNCEKVIESRFLESENTFLKLRGDFLKELNKLENKIVEEYRIQAKDQILNSLLNMKDRESHLSDMYKKIHLELFSLLKSKQKFVETTQVDLLNNSLQSVVAEKVKSAMSNLISQFENEKNIIITLYENLLESLNKKVQECKKELEECTSIFSPKLRELKSIMREEVIQSMQFKQESEIKDLMAQSNEEVERRIFELEKRHRKDIQDTIGHYAQTIDELEVKFSNKISFQTTESERKIKDLNAKLCEETFAKIALKTDLEKKIKEERLTQRKKYEDFRDMYKRSLKEAQKAIKQLEHELNVKNDLMSSLSTKYKDSVVVLREKLEEIKKLKSETSFQQKNIGSLLEKQGSLRDHILKLEANTEIKEHVLKEKNLEVEILLQELDKSKAKIISLTSNNDSLINKLNSHQMSQHKASHGSRKTSDGKCQELKITDRNDWSKIKTD